jgi:glycosyltransferase involved in cell wall biosynthesis
VAAPDQPVGDAVPPLRKVAIVNTADEGGGAERASMALLDGLLELGLDAWLLVGNRTGQHPRVVSFHESPFFDYRPFADPQLLAEVERQRNIDRQQGLEDFNYPYSHHIGELTGSPPDLVVCHNLHGGYFDLRALPALSRQVPVVLRLFDTWLQAGHCAYSLGCTRWRIGCGECPDLTIPPAIALDASHANLKRKQAIFAASRVYVSTETQWMLHRARQSVVAPAAVEWKHIPGGVDLSVFSPGSREDSRRHLNLDAAADVLVYVASQGAANPYKDFETVRRAMAELQRRRPPRPILLQVVGSSAPDEDVGPGVTIRHAGPVASQPLLATYYRAADVLVHAAIEETFGNVVAEALACGTPVVAASGGGVVELIDHGRTGLVTPPRQPLALADAIERLLREPALRTEMGVAAAAARQRFDGRAMVESLHAWFAEIHASWYARPAG